MNRSIFAEVLVFEIFLKFFCPGGDLRLLDGQSDVERNTDADVDPLSFFLNRRGSLFSQLKKRLDQSVWLAQREDSIQRIVDQNHRSRSSNSSRAVNDYRIVFGECIGQKDSLDDSEHVLGRFGNSSVRPSCTVNQSNEVGLKMLVLFN